MPPQQGQNPMMQQMNPQDPNNKFSKMFETRNNKGSNFGNFSGLNAFVNDSDEEGSGSENSDSDSDEQEGEQAITSMMAGPPPPVAQMKKEPTTVDEIQREKSKRDFQEKYFVMDKVLSQVVYDALNSKRRQAINMHSVNGIN